jgi:cell division protease FtsH
MKLSEPCPRILRSKERIVMLGGETMQNPPKGLLICLALGLLGLLFLAPFVFTDPLPEQTYSQFRQDVEQQRVQGVVITNYTITANYVSGDHFTVALPTTDQSMSTFLLAHHVSLEYRDATGSWFSTIWVLLLPLAILGLAIWYLSGRSGSGAGQAFTFSQTRAQMHMGGDRRITMNDVAGLNEVKEELGEIIDFLRSPHRYVEMGASIPKGVLLSGPPGTGKTLLARAVAGEASVPFFHMAGSEFVEIFAGVGASRVRDLFEKARNHAPCIVFIDEIDAVARQRGASVGGGNDEREQTLNQLLVEMDGFSATEGIIIMAATNRADVLDQAILRPGRFDRHIYVDPPDRPGRLAILCVHALGKRIDPAVDLDRIAATTVGFTGADLANLINEAALLTVRRRKPLIGMDELSSAIERVITGSPQSLRVLGAAERSRVAYHEAGHAVVARYLASSDPIEKVTILPRGRALGYVMHLPREDRYLHGRQEMFGRISVLLAGRAAEEAMLAIQTTGAADDLERATQMARRMVVELGMSTEIGPVNVADTLNPGRQIGGVAKAIADTTTAVVDMAIHNLLVAAYTQAVSLLHQHAGATHRIAAALLERESLNAEELECLLDTGVW